MYAEGEDFAKEKTFVPLSSRFDVTRTMGCQESLWVQHLALAQYPQCMRIMSNFHAGCGPPSAGDNFRRKVDACVVTAPGQFLLAQYHSSGFHYYNHLEICVRKCSYINEMVIEESVSASESEDTWPQQDSDSEVEEKEDDLQGRDDEDDGYNEERQGQACKKPKLNDDPPSYWWRRPMEDAGIVGAFDTKEDFEEAMESDQFVLKERTLEGDSILRSYVAAMNWAVHEARKRNSNYPSLAFDAKFSYECQFFHGGDMSIGTEGHGGIRTYNKLTKLLKDEFGDDAIVGFSVPRLKEAELLRRILYDEDYNGFCTIRGGKEGRDDAASLTQAFCLGKHVVSADELGDYALEVTAMAKGLDPQLDRAKAKRQLQRDCLKRCLTMTRRFFGCNQLSTLSTLQLRFLVTQRNFHNFRLVHFIHCHLRTYLFDFNFRILQERHRLKREEPSNELGQLTCKLIFNSSYGYYNLNTSRYHKTSVCTMRTIWSKHKKEAAEGKIVSCSLLGPVWIKSKKGPKEPDLLYSVTKSRPDCQIENLSHVSATILELSHYNFMSHLVFMLTVLSPRMAELVYADTG